MRTKNFGVLGPQMVRCAEGLQVAGDTVLGETEGKVEVLMGSLLWN